MSQISKAAYETKYNDASTGLYKSGQTLGIGSDDHRTQVTDHKDSLLWWLDHVKDEDNMASDSANHVPTQQSVKAYVDSHVPTALAWKNPCKAATTANITLSGTQTIDGISIGVGDRVLVKDQTAATENGLYVCAAGAWTRATDADSAAELEGAAVIVQQGTTNADTTWVQTTDGITLGSSNIVWAALATSVPDASETVKGKVELATTAEVITGTDTVRAVTPAGVKAAAWYLTGTNTLSGAVTVAMGGFNIAFLNGNTLFGPTGATGVTTAVEGTTVTNKMLLRNDSSASYGDYTAEKQASAVNSSRWGTYKARAGGTAVQNGDRIGEFSFFGHDGTDYNYSARFDAIVDGAVSANTVPMALTFWTSPNQNPAMAERMRITSSGLVGIGTSTVTANTRLDVRGSGTTTYNTIRLANGSNTGVLTYNGYGQLAVTPTSPTSLTASVEFSDFVWSGNRVVEWATGALTTQRFAWFKGATLAFVGASTVTNAYNVYIDDLITGTNATIVGRWALGVGGNVKIVQSVHTSGSPSGLQFTGGAHTTLAAGGGIPDVWFVLGRTVQRATGACTEVNGALIENTTYSFVGASTITDAYTLKISGASAAGSNATITNAHGLYIGTSAVAPLGTVTNAFSLSVVAPTGATNNYSAQFSGGLGVLLNDIDLVLGTTTGTKFGSATSQKLGFWNATPIVQPTTGVASATFTANSGTAVNDASTFDGYTVGQITKALRNMGLLA